MKVVAVLLALVVWLSGCGTPRQDAGSSTSTIVALNGFSNSEQNDIIDAIESLNSGLNTTLVEPFSSETGYPITISIFYPNGIDSRVGFARRRATGCEVQLSSVLFDERKDLQQWVIWHEIGHCYGLVHDTDPRSLMYHTTGSDYDSSSVNSFQNTLLNAAGIQ